MSRLMKGQRAEEARKERYKPSRWDEFLKKLVSRQGISAGDFQNPDVAGLPEDVEPISRGSRAWNYLVRDRGFTPRMIEYYDVHVGTKDMRDLEPEERKKFVGSGRVVFLDRNSMGSVVYWVARTFVGHKIRYKNAPVPSDNQVFNLVGASKFPSVVVAEGVFSAIAAGKNGVCTYGKEVTDKQVQMLADVKFERYYIALDGDAKKNTLRLAAELSSKGCNCYLVKLAYDEDPDSVNDFESRLMDSIPFTFSNRLRFMMG